MDLLKIVFRAYPTRNITALILILLAALSEGFGVMMFLPLLASVMGEPIELTSGLIDPLNKSLSTVGIEPTIGPILIVIVIFIMAKSGLTVLAATQVGYTSARMMTDLRIKLIRSLMKARWSYFVTQPSGVLATALGHEAKLASSSYNKAIKLVSEVLQVMIYGGIAVLASWQLTIAAAFFGSVSFVALYSLIRVVHSASDRNAYLMRSLVDRFTDSISLIKPIKAMALEPRLLPLLEHESDEINLSHRREILGVALFQGLSEPLTVLILAIGAFITLVHLELPFSEVLFMAVILQRMVTRISTVQGSYQALVSSQTTFWRLQNSINEAEDAEEKLPGTKRVDLKDGIVFRDMQFSYGQESVLQNVNFKIPFGRCTALIGPSGAGKTTILDLLTGLINANEGGIVIDGVPITDIDLRWWRTCVGYVPQDSILFHDSILANVTLGDPRLTEVDAEHALRDAGLWSFVEKESEGLATMVGERGTRLSGGQRQRLAIARALIRKPNLLILDEATASLDPETEVSVINSLARLKGKVTIVAISHQPTILTMADSIYRIEHGSVSKMEQQTIGKSSL